MLSHRKTNGSQQPDVSSGRHRKQALVFTQAVCVREREIDCICIHVHRVLAILYIICM